MEINTSLSIVKYKNSLLSCYTMDIVKSYKNGQKSIEEIAQKLRLIKEDKKWKDDFETFGKYCEQLGITDKYAYRIIDGLTFKELDERLQYYTLSQCIELKRSNNIDSLLDNDIVNNGMTCKRIREIVDAQLKATLDDNKEQDDTDDTQLEEKVINVESTPVNMTLVFDNGDHFFYTEDKALLAEIYALIKERGLK